MQAVLLPLVVIVPLIGFWLWAFNDMLHNETIPDSYPRMFEWPPQAKNQWTVFFLLLSLLTAGYYYFTVYRDK